MKEVSVSFLTQPSSRPWLSLLSKFSFIPPLPKLQHHLTNSSLFPKNPFAQEAQLSHVIIPNQRLYLQFPALGNASIPAAQEQVSFSTFLVHGEDGSPGTNYLERQNEGVWMGSWDRVYLLSAVGLTDRLSVCSLGWVSF